MKRDLFWIPGPGTGKLAVVARPRGGDWLDDEASRWRKLGLDVIVSLLEEAEAAELGLDREAEVLESKEVRFVSFPIPDRGVPASTNDALSVLTKIGSNLEAGRNVGIHCRQSVGRSGLIAAGLLVTSGMDSGEAVDVVTMAREQEIPETSAQLEWIKRLPSGHLVPKL